MAKQMLHTKALVVKENIVEQTGVIDAIVGSTNVLDRMGDIIDQNGWDLKDYKSNPVILWGHNVREERPPIGKALKVWIEDKGKDSAKLMFKVQFDLLDSFAAEIFRKIKDGFLNTVSVGFLPLEWEELDPDNWFGGLKYTKQQLLELSPVCVPANPQALVGLRSFAEKDKRFTPEEEKLLYPQTTKEVLAEILHKDLPKEDVVKPYENEHSCRLRNPDDFQDDSFRSTTRDHNGKEYRVIMGKLQGKDTMTEQAFRYNKETWTESEANTHCKDHDGTFEPAKKEETSSTEIKPEEVKTEKDSSGMLTKMGEHIASMDGLLNKMEDDMSSDSKTVAEADITAMQGHAQSVDGLCDDMMDMMPAKDITPLEAGKDDNSAEPVKPVEQPKENEEVVSKKVIPYKDLGTLPESEGWDGPGEISKADIDDLKLICTWYDSDKSDDKGSYKLPHHKVDSHKAVWRGVAAAMGALLGARGGADIPEGDRKGIFNHLAKHYKEFDKTVPDFKMVEDQILAGFDEEIQALTLDREDKHVVRLVKKVLDNDKKEQSSFSKVIEALKVLNLALVQINLKKKEVNK